jgi:hypothetical protein
MMLLVLRGRYGLWDAIMHSRIRIVGGICFGVVAVMCTAIPLLLAQDRSRPFSAATLAAEAKMDQFVALEVSHEMTQAR